MKCCFCGCTQASALAYSRTDSVYICNGTTGAQCSDIVYYLKHKPNAILERRGTAIKCQYCSSTEVYNLGLCGSVLVCRACVLARHKGSELGREFSRWSPLVADNALINEIVAIPHTQVTLNKDQMKTVMSGMLPAPKERIRRPVLEQLEYDERSPKDRLRKLLAFVQEEEYYERAKSGRQIYTAPGVVWEDSSNFEIGADRMLRKRFTKGSLVSVSQIDASKSDGVYGTVTSSEPTIHIRLRQPMQQLDSVQISLWHTGVSFQRQSHALINVESVCDPLFLDILSGNMTNINARLKHPGRLATFFTGTLSKLDAVQKKAVLHALSYKCTVIQGPPGSGKSTCMAMLAVSWARSGKTVLICTRDNAAADHIAEILMQQDEQDRLGVGYIRVVGETYRECVPKKLLPLCSHSQNTGNKNYDNDLEAEKIARAKIIISTLCCCGGARFDSSEPKVLIVDEANTVADPDLCIPLSRFRIEALTLYGDQNQIGAFTHSLNSKQHGYDRTLIQRLAVLGKRDSNVVRIHPFVPYEPIMLTNQYRMHPALAKFPSRAFYDNRVTSGISATDRVSSILTFEWPNPQIPRIFWNITNSKEHRTSDGKSIMNASEVVALSRILDLLHRGGIGSHRIGVITFYQGQLALADEAIKRMCSAPTDWLNGIEMDTVDAYEGRDVDYVIILCVRSNRIQNGNRIGFLADRGRFLVSITRARYGLFVIGNAATLETTDHWRDFISECRSTRTLVTDIASRY